MAPYNFEIDRSQLDPEELEMFDEMNQAIDDGTFELVPPTPEEQKRIQEAAAITNQRLRKS